MREIRFQRSAPRVPVRLINLLGRSLRQLNISLADLEEQSLVVAARKRAGLNDLGSESFRVPLQLLLTSLKTEARLHDFGRILARQAILRSLVNRLRLQADWKQYPEILAVSVPSPIFIVGLPRTGTTLLHYLLAQDCRRRWLAHWEAVSPSPPPTGESRNDPRRRAAARDIWLLNFIAPNARAMHEVEPSGPQECVPLLENDFAGFQLVSMFHVPEWQRWAECRDFTGTYAYYRKQLQLLQWRCAPERWLLKSSAHLYGLDALLRVFPDARVIHLHRDPTRVIASFCSLMATMYSAAALEVDTRAIGANWLRSLSRAANHALMVREATRRGSFHDVQYADLLTDPFNAVRAIYRFLQEPLDRETEASMREWLTGNPQHTRGIHRYSLAEFGLSEEAVRAEFARYQERFDVPLEA